VENIRIGGFIIGRHQYFLGLWVIAMAAAIYYVVWRSVNRKDLTIILSVVAITLSIIPATKIALYESKRLFSEKSIGPQEKINFVDLASKQSIKHADIYYIILDAYASTSTLKEIYGYDNGEFEKYLRDKGFYIASKSRSNYTSTFLSLASSLNMDYLNRLRERLGEESRDRSLAHDMIKNNKVMRILKSRGYNFVHFRTVFPATGRNYHADWDVECGRFFSTEFYEMLIQTTMLRVFKKYLDLSFFARERILCIFDVLPEVQHKMKGPNFIFAHITIPHPPYIFGPNGEARDAIMQYNWKRLWQQKDHYLNQLRFVNKKIIQVVDRILSEADAQPIIILQSDHGPQSTGVLTDPHKMLFEERMRILNAYHLPYGGENLLYESITPVNSFRVILRNYFNMDYELLEDRSIFSDYSYPFKFLDITEILTSGE
jgi:hypothetical protein